MKNKLGKTTKWILYLCSAGLAVVLFVPLWTIDLVAPQYPEGLTLVINPGGLGGNVDIINGLNHYIGMKTLHNADFIEFTILPYLIGGFAVFFLLTAIASKRKLLYVTAGAYILFGIIAMVDFYKWEYNYGHNLNPEAAIIVPGMAYQPPLIGYKQLLNFSAYSFPSIGGWIFIAVGVLVIFTVYTEIKKSRVHFKPGKLVNTVAIFSLLLLFSSCSTKPEPVMYGRDNCSFCKMTITDKRFGGEIITKKGRPYKFDDAGCLVQFMKMAQLKQEEIAGVYFVDFTTGKFIPQQSALLYSSEALKSPMNGNVCAFDNHDSLDKYSAQYSGTVTTWEHLFK